MINAQLKLLTVACYMWRKKKEFLEAEYLDYSLTMANLLNASMNIFQLWHGFYKANTPRWISEMGSSTSPRPNNRLSISKNAASFYYCFVVEISKTTNVRRLRRQWRSDLMTHSAISTYSSNLWGLSAGSAVWRSFLLNWTLCIYQNARTTN